MDSMPPFARENFIADLRSAIGRAKSANGITAPVEMDITDVATGKVMQAVSG
jgi:hypothetical protein